MPISTSNDDVGIQKLPVADWGLGMITSKPRTEIEENAAQRLLNFEFDESNNISTRRGVIQLMASTFASRITSLHFFTGESGDVGALFTTGALLKIVQTDGSGETNLTGALTLPSDTFWQWRTFDGNAIGVNGASSGDNPIKVTNAAVASQLAGTPPKGRYIEVWNNRVWIAGGANPNTVRGSYLGDAEQWTADGNDAHGVAIEVDPDDGDHITGLWATRSALYVFKRKRIYRIVPIDANTAATAATNLKVEVYAQNIGCVSGYSIASVLDDVVFLSEQGLASLSLVSTAEDFKTALYSRNIAEIAKTPKVSEEIPCVVFDSASQYMLSFPASISLKGEAEGWVMDYLRVNEQVVRWSRFNGLVAGTAYTSYFDATTKTYLIGAQNGAGTWQIYKYRPRDAGMPFSDNGAAYTKLFETKSFNVGAELIRKQWHKWGFGFDLLATSAALAIQYYFDGNQVKGGAYSFNLSSATGGAFWDVSLWDAADWDSGIIEPQDIVRRLLVNQYGQRSQDITFIVSNNQDGQGFTIRDFLLWWSPLNDRRVTEV